MESGILRQPGRMLGQSIMFVFSLTAKICLQCFLERGGWKMKGFGKNWAVGSI
jgi:hypothetical protein